MSPFVKILVGIVSLIVLIGLLIAAWHFLLGVIVFVVFAGIVAALVRRWYRARERSRPSDLHPSHESHFDAEESLQSVKRRLDAERQKAAR